MNKIIIAIIAVSMSFIAGCATTGESYTDEGIGKTGSQEASPAVEAATSQNLADDGVLPEIAPYDEPEIPALEVPEFAFGDVAVKDISADANALPEIAPVEEPAIPALDAPAAN
ncbi:MAG: hypothetical protein HOO90_07405 [Methylotenera sp.]|uniref:hypothetical protein n=1 Tax=Methylotenera sp. TaxID=2051956 RepID=UPI0018189A71|nr:hypothetical protein [Methylotenera sp.]NOU25347.1 hypothetical protein [Methylotenera sp.]